MIKFLVVTDAHLIRQNGKKVAYAPYVKEMDLWMRYVDEVTFICPSKITGKLLAQPFLRQDFNQIGLRRLEFHTLGSAIISFITVPYQFFVLCFAFAKADHIHLRCPGNLALLASIAQVLFPSKKKTAKYAGNFDPNAVQPIAYRWQKRILSNSFLTKNIDILAYGKWPDQSENVKPFFTATYKRNQITPLTKRDWNGPFKAVFVGTMGANKRPIEVFEIIKEMIDKGIDISIDFYGDGPLRTELESRVKLVGLEDKVRLHGNVDNSIVTEAYKNAHFSFLLSKSEGWPKAVAEAMFWGCIPIASQVSCVPWMLGAENSKFQIPNSKFENDTSSSKNNASSSESREEACCERGILIKELSTAEEQVTEYLSQPDVLQKFSENAATWSRQYTLDDFEEAIQQLIQND
ncbi:glycosyltransferase involved in cell wall biosynthesis [Nonlabens dokdonensis]|jgi:glycosyltransferase involved in cell wall biosynthesis|uniref:Glycosyltransferase n=2 Tax=Nonlabens dokdonensis TaxID=328515 RepID=L7WEX3_NONDD|nr:glycosyltransferase [Nonlabens dokdonensis]AGC77428.1 glycosyltransferase [Nonlabens dokdonensis DSW-6]PZX40954.1 glycosyltransferase involved in cell wall biosynthesis [Nonlabens dokdonensis]